MSSAAGSFTFEHLSARAFGGLIFAGSPDVFFRRISKTAIAETFEVVKHNVLDAGLSNRLSWGLALEGDTEEADTPLTRARFGWILSASPGESAAAGVAHTQALRGAVAKCPLTVEPIASSSVTVFDRPSDLPALEPSDIDAGWALLQQTLDDPAVWASPFRVAASEAAAPWVNVVSAADDLQCERALDAAEALYTDDAIQMLRIGARLRRQFH